MFEMARRGLQDAIGLLRGKSQSSVFVGTDYCIRRGYFLMRRLGAIVIN